MGSRGSSSGGMGGGGASSSRASFMSNERNMEDYAVAVGMFDRDFLATADGKAALQEFMEGEIEAGLTEQEMRQAIRDAGSSSDRDTRTTGSSGSYSVSEVPSRIQSFTTVGTGVSGDWESKTYVTKKGDAIKTVTKYADGTKTTYTDAKNYGTEYDKTRAQYESILSDMAKAEIRTGSEVTAIDDR